MPVRRVALLTAGGLAPCLSSAVGGLDRALHRARARRRDHRLPRRLRRACWPAGPSRSRPRLRERAHLLHQVGGSPLGNSRVKLTNVADAVKRGLVQEGQDPLEVAAERLTRDGVDVLHTIGGDDTNTTAADLAAFLQENGHALTVVGLPKTIDNDVVPIKQSLGAWTAAEQGALFARNVVAEHSSNPRMLVVHEVMGRNCGWLTAETARRVPPLGDASRSSRGSATSGGGGTSTASSCRSSAFDIGAEAERLRGVMDELGCVNLFVSEGAGVETIVAELESRGEERAAGRLRPRQARHDQPGRVVRQAVRRAAGRREDDGAEERLLLALRRREPRGPRAHQAVHATWRPRWPWTAAAASSARTRSAATSCAPIEFPRIKGGKPFDTGQAWFARAASCELGQPLGEQVAAAALSPPAPRSVRSGHLADGGLDAQVPGQPRDGGPDERDPVGSREQLVALALEEQVLVLDAAGGEGGHDLLGLLDRHVRVVRAVDDEQRGGRAGRSGGSVTGRAAGRRRAPGRRTWRRRRRRSTARCAA